MLIFWFRVIERTGNVGFYSFGKFSYPEDDEKCVEESIKMQKNRICFSDFSADWLLPEKILACL